MNIQFVPDSGAYQVVDDLPLLELMLDDQRAPRRSTSRRRTGPRTSNRW